MLNFNDKQQQELIEKVQNLKFSISGYSSDSGIKAESLSKMDPEVAKALYALQEHSEEAITHIPFLTSEDEVADFGFPNGVTVIFGPSSSGKTTVAKYLRRELEKQKKSAIYIRFHEPELPTQLETSTFLKGTWGVLTGQVYEHIIIDSFKFFAYNSDSKAAAMSGGISAQLFTELTNLSIVAQTFQKKVFIILNFLSESDKTVDIIHNAVIGSVVGAINTSRLSKQIMCSMQARTSENDRTKVNLFLPTVDHFKESTKEPKAEVDVTIKTDSKEFDDYATALSKLK